MPQPRPITRPDPQDEDLDDRSMAAIAAGDANALQDIFDRWKLPMLNFLYRALGSHADAEDLSLEVFTEVWRSASRYRAQGTFSAWLYTIARGKLRHEWRRRGRRPVMAAPPESMDPPDPAASPTDSIECEETLLQGLLALPEAQREALLLSVHSGLSTVQIASALGVSTNNLYVLIHRARERLRQHFSTQS
jgi:RNA polymerase sigma-70 factor, ECF subfamily